jgi:ABC-2 type transport system permease protein
MEALQWSSEMKKILNIAWKDLKNRFSNPMEIMFFLVLPIIFTYLLSGTIGSGSGMYQLLVVDQDQTALSDRFIEGLASAGTMEIVSISEEESEAAAEAEETAAILTIPTGFQAQLYSGESIDLALQVTGDEDAYDAAEQQVFVAVEQMDQVLLAANVSTAEYEKRGEFSDGAARETYFEESYTRAEAAFDDLPQRVEIRTPDEGVVYEREKATSVQASAGQLITWVFIPLLTTAAVLADERTTGTLRRLFTTPTNKATFLLGTILGQLVAAWVQMTLLVIFGIYVLGIDWGNSVAGLVVLLLAFSLAATALGTLLGTLVRSTAQAGSLAPITGMVMALVGGCWFPEEMFSDTAKTVNQFLPTTWALHGLNDLGLRRLGLVDILPEAGVLMIFAVVFFALAIWCFRYE